MNRTVTRLLALMLLLCPFTLLAQKDVITVTGTVVDSYDEPLIGVSVLVKGTNNGMSTNIDGEFTLKAAVGDVLQFSYIGFKDQEAAVTGTAPMRIVLEENTEVLEEVVVTAMGIRRKEASLTYATQEVKGEDLMRVQDANFVNSLGGKVAGVTIQQSAGGAGGASKILLRGNKSVMGNNAPLIVVDGIPMTNQVGGAAESQWQSDAYGLTYAGTSESGDALSLINPDDIESINVLKGANAAALYGSAAANGVLMITTKKGKEGKITVTLNSNVTFEKPLMTPKLQRTYGAAIIGTTLGNDAWGPKLSDMTSEDLAFAGAKLTNRATNQVDDFYGTGTTWNNAVSVSGGTEKITSFFSFSNSNSDGMVPNNTYNRNTFSFRQSYNLFDKRLHIDVALNYVYAKTVNRPGGGTVQNPLYDLYTMAPNIDINYYKNNYKIAEGHWLSNPISFYNGAGNYISGTAELEGPMQNWAYSLTAARNNPYWLTNQNRANRVDERIYGYATANFEIIPGLNIQGRLNMDRARQEYTSRRYATTANPAEFERYGIYNNDKYVSTDIYVDALLSYNKNFKEDWDVSATVGWSGHTTTGNSTTLYGNATYLSTGMDKLPTTVNLFEPTISWLGSPVSYSKSSNWDKGLFFTGQVGWKEMVFVEGSYRQDWYRSFKQFAYKGTPSNYGYYSFGVNTLVHKYLKLPEVISYLKVRASYSEVGNSIPNILYSTGTLNKTTGAVTGSSYAEFDNPRPEKSKSFEAGYDISFFNNEVMWDLTYYHTDLANSYFLSSASGSKQKPVNTGLIRNQGIETTITYNHIFSKDWIWRTAFNFSYNHNRIKKTYKNEQGQWARMEQSVAAGHVLVRYEKGGSYGDMYALDLRRYTAEEAARLGNVKEGDIWLSPKNGNPQLSTTNYVYLGNMNSKYNLGWSNTISWKDLSLYFMISGRIGGKTLSLTESYLDNLGVSARTGAARLNAEKNNIVWTSPRTGQQKPGMEIEGGTIVPIQEYYQVVGGQFYAPDYTYDATNFRMAEISLGYTMRNLFHGFIKSLNVSVVGRNLFFIYKDSPVDPDISLSTKNGLGAFDVFNVPSVRSFGINLKLEF